MEKFHLHQNTKNSESSINEISAIGQEQNNFISQSDFSISLEKEKEINSNCKKKIIFF